MDKTQVRTIHFRYLFIKVAILGGGNGAHFSACVIGSNPNFVVNVMTRRPKEWSHTITGTTKGS